MRGNWTIGSCSNRCNGFLLYTRSRLARRRWGMGLRYARLWEYRRRCCGCPGNSRLSLRLDAGRVHRGLRNNRPTRRLGRNRRKGGRRGNNDPRFLPRLGHNPARGRRRRSLDWGNLPRWGRRCRRLRRCSRRRSHGCRSHGRRWRHREVHRTRSRCCRGSFFFPLQYLPHRIARLRNLRPVNLRLLPIA